jgi:hypothetical protein
MMEQAYRDFIQDIVISLHANLREIRERRNFAAPDERDYIEGKMLAYQEVISLLQSGAKEFKLPGKELGL